MRLSIRLAIRFFLMLMLPAAGHAAPFAAQVNNLVGVWFSTNGGEGDARASVIRLVNVLSVNDKSAAFVGHFGSVERGSPEAKDVVARPEGDSLTLGLTARSGARVALRLEAGGALAGTLESPDGRKLPMRFEKTTLPVVHRWMADNPRPGLRAGKDSVIELLFLSAENCHYCREWEKEYIQKGKLRNAPEWSQIRFTEAQRLNFNAVVRAGDLPAHLQPAIEQFLKNRGSPLIGSPWFVVLVNGKIRTNTLGVNSFDSLVFTTIRAAIRERAADGRV